MKQFLNTSTTDPIHNTLRRAIESLAPDAQDKVSTYWNDFFEYFTKFCSRTLERRPGEGLYTASTWAVIAACYHEMDAIDDKDAKAAFSQLKHNAGNTIAQCSAIDMKVNMYWYSFAEQYKQYMSHCNNLVFDEFQKAVANNARELYAQNPNQDIQLTALAAVQQATIHIARKSANNSGIGADMTVVSQIAVGQKEMLLKMPTERYEPRDYVDHGDTPSQYEEDMDELLSDEIDEEDVL